MNPTSKYSLQRSMITYFLLIGFASLLVGVEFLMDTHRPELKQALIDNFQQYTVGRMGLEAVFVPIDALRNKALLMIGIILSVILIVLTMFIKNITGPLQHMIDISRKITGGDLSRTVAVDAHNELAELGGVINEMSSNLQEIILLSRNLCLSGGAALDRAAMMLAKPAPDAGDLRDLVREIDNLKIEIDGLNNFINMFSFYAVAQP